jgi:shikimate kinase
MIIFLRGLPGSGKTTIAKELAEKLNTELISIDKYKKELMSEKPEANFVKEIVPESYKRALLELKNKKDNLIVEEVFRNKEFVSNIEELCNQENINAIWFKITRTMEDIITTNNERKRGIKNTPEVLEMMNTQLNEIKIKNEIEIKNVSIDESVDTILKTIQTN